MATNLPTEIHSTKTDPSAMKRVSPNSGTPCTAVGLPGVQVRITTIS